MQYIPGRSLETFVEYLPRPRQLGGVPPRPPAEGVPPPASTLRRPPTTSSAKLLPSQPGADTQSGKCFERRDVYAEACGPPRMIVVVDTLA
jgi:hypothetical protein